MPLHPPPPTRLKKFDWSMGGNGRHLQVQDWNEVTLSDPEVVQVPSGSLLYESSDCKRSQVSKGGP